MQGKLALLVLIDGRSIKIRIEHGSKLNDDILYCCDEENKNIFFYTRNLIAVQLLDETDTQEPDETEKPSV